ncbi:FMN-binding protein [Actinocrinis puniceicyclus]|uniref:FMN-binding protein n=1 Tax=Actinocrinis puniceicyclus TaxID=977794 RepID=A0A8J7WM40_9ACTN|nr:FMN-binding protein [Actinocrinis puniceicyclus]MBS2963798.1 FMN-binding protein [Actinocrinis puniceicyclus]
MRRTAVFITTTVLAMLALLGMKEGARAGYAAKVVRGNDTMTVTGPQVVLAHGIVQVRVTITGGRIVDVDAVSLPHDNPHSWAGGNYAATRLRGEVLAKQSAEVDIVSGATYTSQGYISSLQAALDAAGLHR